MNNLDILKALLNGNHLEPKELRQVDQIIHNLLIEYKSRYNEPPEQPEPEPVNIQIQRMYRFETDRPLKAFVDIIINDCLLIKGLSVMNGKKGLFVQMPREQAKDKKWYEIVRCLTPELMDQLEKTILSTYNEE